MDTDKEPLQIRLPKGSGQKLKILAARRKTSISELAQEALGLWWLQQPDAKAEGELFPGEASNAATATPATKESAPKKPTVKGAKKVAPQKKTPPKMAILAPQSTA